MSTWVVPPSKPEGNPSDPHAEPSWRSGVRVVLPAYNAARTLEATLASIPAWLSSQILLVDDASHDDTVRRALELGLRVRQHPQNRGYGANQKTCYAWALEDGAHTVVMLHPDNQYEGAQIPALLEPLRRGEAEVVLGSRFLGHDPRRAGMPHWRYLGNRGLTTLQNRLYRAQLSEYHTGMRAFLASALEQLPLEHNSDGFIFDQEILSQAFLAGLRVKEVPVGCRYEAASSSISLGQAIMYGLRTCHVALSHSLQLRVEEARGVRQADADQQQLNQ